MSMDVTRHNEGGPVESSKTVQDTKVLVIRGKYGDQELPIQVDSEGRLVVSGDLGDSGGDEPIPITVRKRSEEVCRWEDVTVPSGATPTFLEPTLVDVSDYVFVVLFVNPQTSHEYDLYVNWESTPALPFGNVAGNDQVELTFYDGTEGQGRSDWIEVSGPAVSVGIAQSSGSNKRYDVVLRGIR